MMKAQPHRDRHGAEREKRIGEKDRTEPGHIGDETGQRNEDTERQITPASSMAWQYSANRICWAG
jgi:hypothetical protein